MKHARALLACVLVSVGAVASGQTPPPGGCVLPAKLEKICLDVMSKTEAPHASPNMYAYEDKIHAAACVLAEDPPQVAAAKIRHMWSALKPTCTGSDFEVTRGNILKYALKVRAFDLVTQAVESWGVELNTIDETDRKTLLDFADYLADRHRGSDTGPIYRSYHRVLRKHGAKYAHELR